MRTATILLVAAALLLTAPAAAAKPTYAEQSDRLVLGNEQVIVTFQGKKPLLHVLDATNASRGYTVHIQRLVEVAPGGPLTGNERVATFDLARAQGWEVSHSTDAEGVHVTIHREGAMDIRRERVGGPPLPIPLPPLGNLTANATAGNASVTLVFHLYERATQVVSGNETLNVTNHEVKFDLLVEQWDWVNPTDVLALEFVLAGPDTNRTAQAQVGGRETEVTDNGTRIGWVGWATQATATYNETARTVEVQHRGAGAGNASADEPQGAKHWLVYQAPGFDRLVHDPSVGVEPTHTLGEGPGGLVTPGAGALALLLAAPAAALLLRRRRGA